MTVRTNRRAFVQTLGAGALGTVTPLGGIVGVAAGLEQASKRTGNPIAGRSVTVEAKPAPISIDTAKTAVIVVDMQNDFGAKGGMFDRAGIDISVIREAVGPTARVLASARRAGIKIVYLKMGFRPDLSDQGASDSLTRVRHQRFGVGETIRTPDGKESRILIRDNWGTDIIPELAPQSGDVVLYKHRFSGFYETELDARLKAMAIKHLIFTGCTTSVCVESTLRDAMFRDYWPLLLADCTGEPIGAGLPRSNHEASLLVIETVFGSVAGSDEFIQALEKHPRETSSEF